jgi:acetyl esterase/lipase
MQLTSGKPRKGYQMETVKLVVQMLAGVAGGLAALASVLLFVRLRWPSPVLWVMKLFVAALSPLLAAIGVLSIVAGLATGSVFISLVGMYDVLVFMLHRFMVTRAPDFPGSFEKAFGLQWEDRIASEQKKYFLPKRTILKLPAVPDQRMEQNIAFATIPGTGRKLLCDVWQPLTNVTSSGLAFIYLHGSAWYLLDKDLGTRPFFSHLAAQGHVIMDVAYRLAPETDMMGMVNDAKRAIAWMKENADSYGINPDRIVVGGGSAGAHLALLAAYTAGDARFIPKELAGKDVSVCAVISLYGPADLETTYFHNNQHLTTRSAPGRPKKAGPAQMPAWLIKRMGQEYHRLNMDKGFANAVTFFTLFGGHPDECPELYRLFSPVTHVHPGCPPTLLLQGGHDVLVPVTATRVLYKRLMENKVPVVMHILPQADHAFDLVLPKISPSAHTAIYDVERFLAIQSASLKKEELKTEELIAY